MDLPIEKMAHTLNGDVQFFLNETNMYEESRKAV